ncbi:N-carbamoyl-L-amino-acid hydrolase [Phyllobacterium trifolii]|uniref:N-carbamoyl-L-amino-acid hydrolase n=1 Tax=Phyllobacterium trifolii TaxID=300193 RepID=A0A839U8K0_9HYPH|nr:Zn-dependent hydrolase [Phyllobacterium trifolii]MBB3147436.1 N-carbamoyl-L-amino-acid hydrolase [Phyllobacterium trifolii]
MNTRARINGERLLQRLDEFAAIGATPAGGVNRQALSPEDRSARAKLANLALERGFGVFQDPMANLFIHRPGLSNDLPPFLIGSHLDSQPMGGRFDGALGTLSAFEVLESLEDASIQTPRAVEVVAWTNEEGSQYAPGCMGSMAFASGAIPIEWYSTHSPDGRVLGEELAATLDALPEAILRSLGSPLSGYLELHIEQGPSLERENIPIGIVHAIQGTRWLEVVVTGQTAHAGTTQLSFRRDPLVAVTEALQELYNSVMPNDERARLTIGRISLEPASINAIPGKVSFSVDLRHPDASELARLEDHVRVTCEEKASAFGCAAVIRRTFDMPPAQFSPLLLQAVDRAATRLGVASKPMLSGAFHDALFLARVTDAAMIFVPCRDGLSHNEAEFVEPEHSILGAQVLLESTLVALQMAMK